MKCAPAYFFLSTILLLLAGCVCRPAVMVRTQAVSQEELLLKIEERAQYWSAYQANIHIRGQSDKGKFRLRAVILAQLPDQFRLEAFTPLGQTAGVLVFNRPGASLWIPSEEVVYSSDHAETLIRHFLGISIPVETFGYSLTASIPPGWEPGGMSALSANSGWTLTSKDSANELKPIWKFLSQPLALQSLHVGQGALPYTVDYEPAVKLEPDRTPEEIRFSSPEWRMEVRIDRMTPDRNIRGTAFNLPASADTRRVRLNEAP